MHLEMSGYVSPNISSEITLVKGGLGEGDDPTDYESWQKDYSSTYLLHVFRPSKPGELANLTGISMYLGTVMRGVACLIYAAACVTAKGKQSK